MATVTASVGTVPPRISTTLYSPPRTEETYSSPVHVPVIGIALGSVFAFLIVLASAWLLIRITRRNRRIKQRNLDLEKNSAGDVLDLNNQRGALSVNGDNAQTTSADRTDEGDAVQTDMEAEATGLLAPAVTQPDMSAATLVTASPRLKAQPSISTVQEVKSSAGQSELKH